MSHEPFTKYILHSILCRPMGMRKTSTILEYTLALAFRDSDN